MTVPTTGPTTSGQRSPLPFRFAPDALPATDADRSGWRILHDELMMPIVVLKQSALLRNLETMAAYCSDVGVSLAPHGKTYMCPDLTTMQLSLGAWAITVANASQARIYRAFGVTRLLIANQVVDAASLAWTAAELNRNPDVEIYCLVDSEAGLDIMERELERAQLDRPLPVLIELGFDGGRSGCRSVEEAVALATTVVTRPHLRLTGVECYEGLLGSSPDEATLRAVDALMLSLKQLATELDGLGLFSGTDEIIVSAGGSAFFDRAVEVLAPSSSAAGSRILASKPVRVLLRCGSYLTYDHGPYQRLSPFGTRLPERPRLHTAFELWGRVTSTPEAGLVILGFGKRDCAYDSDTPIPLQLARDGVILRDLDDAKVADLNDHHAYVRLSAADDDVRVGDLISFGMSHPCTIFDKWKTIPVVDDDRRVVRYVTTYF